jgi:hypothetical protein
MLSAYLFDPTSKKTVAEQVAYNDTLETGKAHSPKDMSAYVTTQELATFKRLHLDLPDSQKPHDMVVSCRELIIRALMKDEAFNREVAEDFIITGLGNESILTQRIKSLTVNHTSSVEEQLLKSASQFHCELTKKIFIAAMRLNQSDYRAFFPERVCVHSSELVLKNLADPDYVPTAEERKQHLLANREMAFSILNSMSIWEIAELVPMESMQVLQNAGRYSTLKEAFTNLDAKEEPAQPAPVVLKDELDGQNF